MKTRSNFLVVAATIFLIVGVSWSAWAHVPITGTAIIDQTRLPFEFHTLRLFDCQEIAYAMSNLLDPFRRDLPLGVFPAKGVNGYQSC